ncbi:DUF1489 family protein [Sandaracinobacteroides sp. A072]|uniref:DUF1489 family protein n=1 Tax=Sandaracinobacteroides sp. A072 TaxID=3461146 RepID=UPI00404347AF
MARTGLTRVAFGCSAMEDIARRQALFTHEGPDGPYVRLTSRRIPRRDLSGGSIFWIIRHTLVARQPILGVEEETDADGAFAIIRLARGPIPVVPRACRAHQGWRYLSEADWPEDRAAGDSLPPHLAAELAGLSLL